MLLQSAIANAILLLVYVGTSVSGLTLLKLGAAKFTLTSLAGAFLYGLGFLLWLLVLYRMPLSRAFPIAAGSLIVGTQLTGAFILGEKIGTLQMCGVVLILGGVMTIFYRTL